MPTKILTTATANGQNYLKINNYLRVLLHLLLEKEFIGTICFSNIRSRQTHRLPKIEFINFVQILPKELMMATHQDCGKKAKS